MRLLFPGAVIRRERLRRSWSQEGLCRGICAVSYLSKIEQGKTAVSPEILQMLFARLKLPWYDDPETMAAAQSLVERCYEALFSGDQKVLDPLREEFSAQEERISNSPFALDGALLRGLLAYPRRPADRGLEPFFDQRQLALQRLLEGRHEEAMRLYPCAYISLTAGIGEYEGGNDIGALDYLRRAYDMAAGDGAVRIMLSAKIYMGNWYCNRIDIENMDIQYRVAERLGRWGQRASCGISGTTGPPPGWRPDCTTRHIPIFPRQRGQIYWRCTSWPSAAKSWGGGRKPLPPLTGQRGWSRNSRRRLWYSRCAVWYGSVWSMRIISSIINTGNGCCTSLTGAAGSCPSDTPPSICHGFWNGTPQTGSTAPPTSWYRVFL